MNNLQNWRGLVNLEYREDKGITKLTRAEHLAPLKTQRPFYRHGPGICETMLLNTAGGIVGGDRLEQSFLLQPNSQVILTTASAGKVYRSQGKIATQNTIIKLKSGAKLDFLPLENIIFNQAFYQQKIRIELSKNTTWLGWDISRFGRTARGEIFEEGEWQSSTEIWQENQLIWLDRQRLVGSKESFNSPNALGGKPVIGTLSYWGKPITTSLVAEIRNLWETVSSQGDGGVTALAGGLICRYRGYSTAEVKQWFIAIQRLIKINNE